VQMIHDALEFAYATGVRIRIRFVKTRVGHDADGLPRNLPLPSLCANDS